MTRKARFLAAASALLLLAGHWPDAPATRYAARASGAVVERPVTGLAPHAVVSRPGALVTLGGTPESARRGVAAIGGRSPRGAAIDGTNVGRRR